MEGNQTKTKRTIHHYLVYNTQVRNTSRLRQHVEGILCSFMDYICPTTYNLFLYL